MISLIQLGDNHLPLLTVRIAVDLGINGSITMVKAGVEMSMERRPALLRRLDIILPISLFLALAVVFIIDSAMKPSMDVVFIFDDGCGMADSAEAVKKNWLGIMRAVKKQGFDCRFASVACRLDSVIPEIQLTTAQEFEKLLAGPINKLPHVNLVPETNLLGAMEEVLNSGFRDGASVVVYLTTNTPIEDRQRLSGVAEQYKSRGIKTIVQGRESERNVFQSVIGTTGGEFYTLDRQTQTDETASMEKNSAFKVQGLISPIDAGSSNARFKLANVEVRGRIALVCDISGSMAGDFPSLVTELRSKFPANTPLVLVVGCRFAPPQTNSQEPLKLSTSTQPQEIYGIDFSNDENVFVCDNVSDAIILAVTEFRRDTVMFNNDLQDGGSQAAIRAFELLFKEQRFTLSGRSLNCDAPQQLKDFILTTGGDFKVDVINRSPSPAVEWTE